MSDRDSVGAIPIARKEDRKALQEDDKKAKQGRERQAEEIRGGPLNNDKPLHPTETVDKANAYKRADATEHRGDKRG